MTGSSLPALWRRVRPWVLAVAAAVIAIGLVEIMPAEMAFLFAGDLVAYLEIAAGLWLLAASARARSALAFLGQRARDAARRGRTLLRRQGRRHRRARRTRALRRPGSAGRNDDAGAAWSPMPIGLRLA